MEYFPEDILEDPRHRKALCALRAPGGIDFARVPAPEVFGIILEEHGIELSPEAVDIEVFKVVFRQLVQHGAEIAEAAFHCRFEAHVPESLRLQGDRIGVELTVEENAGNSAPLQHDDVGFFRIRAAGSKLRGTPEDDIVVRGSALHGHHFLPPVIHFRNLGEKPVAAHIHAVPTVFNSSGDPAEQIGFFQHGNIGMLVSGKKLIGCRQPCRASADDNYFFHPFSSPDWVGWLDSR